MVISYQEPTLLTMGNRTTNGWRAADAIGYGDQLLMLYKPPQGDVERGAAFLLRLLPGQPNLLTESP